MKRKIAEGKLETLKPRLCIKPLVFLKKLYRFKTRRLSLTAPFEQRLCVKCHGCPENSEGKEMVKQATGFFGESRFNAPDNGTYTIGVSLRDRAR